MWGFGKTIIGHHQSQTNNALDKIDGRGRRKSKHRCSDANPVTEAATTKRSPTGFSQHDPTTTG